MTEEEIQNLPEILKRHIGTLEKVSYDSARKESMSSSQIKVIEFDKIPKEYARGKGYPSMPKSNDALYRKDGKWHFVEFKNGSISKDELYRKLYDSLIILIELGVIEGFSEARENVTYTLVYNQEQSQNRKEYASASRKKTWNYISERAKQEVRVYGIGNFQGYLFRETHTYTPLDFAQKTVAELE